MKKHNVVSIFTEKQMYGFAEIFSK